MNADQTQSEQETVRQQVISAVSAAKNSTPKLVQLTTTQKDEALEAIAKAIESNVESIVEANVQDVADAREKGLTSALIDRLTLTPERIRGMVESVRAVIRLSDPVGEILRTIERPNGLRINKVRVPLGVIGIIYESRPNVTCDCAALCLKSGNAVVLRGGSESFRSTRAIHRLIQDALKNTPVPPEAVTLIPVKERAGVDCMLQLSDLIDIIIPRGGESLIRKIAADSKIPVIKHAKGVCHVYVDAAADLSMAEAIAVNAKCQRPGVCNAMETLLVHEAVAVEFLSRLNKAMEPHQVEIRGCPKTQKILASAVAADEGDWDAEYLDLILAVRIVDSVADAIDHIRRYGSGHSEAIVTGDEDAAQRFLNEVDASAVYVNASTRFTDGFEFGMGAEMGISTDRLHARGPVALEELTTYKYVIYGTGQIK